MASEPLTPTGAPRPSTATKRSSMRSMVPTKSPPREATQRSSVTAAHWIGRAGSLPVLMTPTLTSAPDAPWGLAHAPPRRYASSATLRAGCDDGGPPEEHVYRRRHPFTSREVIVRDTPSPTPDHRAELVDGPAAGQFRAIDGDDAPPATLDVALDDGTHVAYIYFGRRGSIDPVAYAYGWDREPPATAPVT